MVIVIMGTTECRLCRQVLDEDDDIVCLPPIFFNRRHPAYEVSDAAVHRGCLLDRSYGAAALAKLAVFARRQEQPKVCAVCGDPLRDPDDYFSIGPLSDHPDEPIARFDWFQAHLHCLPGWAGREDLVSTLEDTIESGTWDGEVLHWLLARAQRALAL